MLLIPPKDIAAIIAQPDGTRLVAEVIDTAYRLSQIPPPRCRVCALVSQNGRTRACASRP